MSPPSAGSEQRPRPRPSGPQQRTTARAQLAQHAQFTDVSPEVGVLDEEAFASASAADPDAALIMLADMTTATDTALRAAAKRLAARLVLDLGRAGAPRNRGTRRLHAVPAERGGDLDVDASMDALLEARGQRRHPGLDELTAREWGRPDLALCLLVDCSGSMGGARLAAAALTAGACAWRAPGEHAVLSFAREVTVLREMDSQRPPSTVVDAVLALRGHGVTALTVALRAATQQLARSRAQRRVVVLLSDCRSTDSDDDPVAVASMIPELVVLAPADDAVQAAEFASRSGARWAPLAGVADAPATLNELLR